MELKVERHPDGDVPVVSVTGDVDVHSAPRLGERVSTELDGGPRAVVIDLSGVEFLDSTGLGALVAARTTATERGIALPVVCSSERILKLFAITGLDGVFDLQTSVDVAVAAIPG